ncbi:ribbon-helix-helix protein, CopG family [Sulfuracidifex metallicus]|uniref:ribbon-helix-helix protein, CopG family n=1 Tax=Sulfuracidifex metallicus TaxID=47303 RepID=UPI002273B0A9|nr:ribbon-helix-helix protein, CopG family [Sulfuracidifex metallicus]MCY0851094.1 ribbon-helix-helix protein, CopG family [Sulfuracidifex metallicus]
MRVVTFKLEEYLLEQLDLLALKKRTARSEIIRQAIEKLLQEEAEKETVPKAKVIKTHL